MKTTQIASLIGLLLPFTALAQGPEFPSHGVIGDPPTVPFQMGEPSFYGSGCSGDNHASFTLAPDGKSVSIIFDRFVTTDDKAIVTKRNRKVTVGQQDCYATLPITLNPGKSITMLKSTIRGFVNIPRHSVAKIKTYHGIWDAVDKARAHRFPKLSVESLMHFSPVVFRGPKVKEFSFSKSTHPLHRMRSKCGGEARIVIGQIVKITSQSRAPSSVTIDSIDSKGDFKKIIYLGISDCE